MQFAGQRTNMKLEPIGQPDNIYVKLTPDVLPDPGAILVTGITPQKTLADGLSEAEFTHNFFSKIAKPDTIFVGFNNVRFDDEFMRFTLYRNFYDAYEWQWQDGRSRWDLLDISRITRALRPDGIKWPFDSKGSQTNQLGLLASVNKLKHDNAHDALSDVMVTIELARLIYNKQPKLFEYLLKMRKKDEIIKLVKQNQPFVYTSGKYPSGHCKTTVVIPLFNTTRNDGVVVYDLRRDPEEFKDLTAKQLAAAWQNRDELTGPILPVKTLKYNRCPAVAPLSVLDEPSLKRLKLDMNLAKENLAKLGKMNKWQEKLKEALKILDKSQQERFFVDTADVDSQLYDGFFDRADKARMQTIRESEPSQLSQLLPKIKDKRLKALLPLYKARNYPQFLTKEEQQNWQAFRQQKLNSKVSSRLKMYENQIKELLRQRLTNEQKAILGELKSYAAMILAD